MKEQKKQECEEQWKKLEKSFRVMQMENPERSSFSVLTWVLAEQGYSTALISRAVNRLVDVDDYCKYCRGNCLRPVDKDAAKDYLYHFATPAVLVLHRYTPEEMKDELMNH